MAPHPLRRQICHRHLGLDAHPRPQWPLPALGHGPGPLQKGLQNLVGLPARHVARAHRDRRNGWIHRVQERRRRRTPRRKGSHEPLPRRTPRRQRLGRVPQTHRARTPPPARALHRSPVQGPQDTCTPDPAYSHHTSNTKYTTCLPAIATSPLRSPGASTRTSLMPTAHPTRVGARL